MRDLKRQFLKNKYVLFLGLCFLLIVYCVIIAPDFSDNTDLSMFYEKEPDIQNGYEGILKDSEKQKDLNLLNYVRERHRLRPVIYNFSDDLYAAKAALIIAANAKLNHYPDT